MCIIFFLNLLAFIYKMVEKSINISEVADKYDELASV